MPLEEPIFLFFLTYLTMNLTSGARLILAAREVRSDGRAGPGGAALTGEATTR